MQWDGVKSWQTKARLVIESNNDNLKDSFGVYSMEPVPRQRCDHLGLDSTRVQGLKCPACSVETFHCHFFFLSFLGLVSHVVARVPARPFASEQIRLDSTRLDSTRLVLGETFHDALAAFGETFASLLDQNSSSSSQESAARFLHTLQYSTLKLSTLCVCACVD